MVTVTYIAVALCRVSGTNTSQLDPSLDDYLDALKALVHDVEVAGCHGRFKDRQKILEE